MQSQHWVSNGNEILSHSEKEIHKLILKNDLLQMNIQENAKPKIVKPIFLNAFFALYCLVRGPSGSIAYTSKIASGSVVMVTQN